MRCCKCTAAASTHLPKTQPTALRISLVCHTSLLDCVYTAQFSNQIFPRHPRPLPRVCMRIVLFANTCDLPPMTCGVALGCCPRCTRAICRVHFTSSRSVTYPSVCNAPLICGAWLCSLFAVGRLPQLAPVTLCRPGCLTSITH